MQVIIDTNIFVSGLLNKKGAPGQIINALLQGDIIALNKAACGGGDIFVNKRVIGVGDIIVIDEKLAIRVQDAMDADKVVNFFFDEKTV